MFSELISLRWLDILDIVIVTTLLYNIYFIVKKTVAIKIFIGIITIVVLWKITEILQMELISSILGQFIGIGFIAIIILFQQELRNFLILLGNQKFLNKYELSFFQKKQNLNYSNEIVKNISHAIISLSKKKIGALIVFSNKLDLSTYINSGILLNSNISKELIYSIFIKESPLHDGAVIIKKNKIVASCCILPISNNKNIPKKYGLRHRAAVGLSEINDADIFVVSEETGIISMIKEQKIIDCSHKELYSLLLKIIKF